MQKPPEKAAVSPLEIIIKCAFKTLSLGAIVWQMIKEVAKKIIKSSSMGSTSD